MTPPDAPAGDDPSSAPESGTGRDETTGNQTADPQRRPPDPPARGPDGRLERDDPTAAGEER